MLAPQQQQSAVSFPYPGSLCVHATERRQQEFEFDSVFGGEDSQVRGPPRSVQAHLGWLVGWLAWQP